MNLRIADEINLPNYRGGGGGGAKPGVASATLVLCPAGMKPSGLIPPNIPSKPKKFPLPECSHICYECFLIFFCLHSFDSKSKIKSKNRTKNSIQACSKAKSFTLFSEPA